MIKNIPVPGIEEYEKGFWEAALESKLVVQHCHDCDQPRFPPRPMCPQCHCLEYPWNQVSGEGEIWSFVVPRPPLLPVFEEISPYAVGLVSIKEYPLIRMIGRLKFNNEQNEDNFRKRLNRYDKFKYIFYKKVQQGFLHQAKAKNKKYLIINSNLNIKENKRIIINRINKIFSI